MYVINLNKSNIVQRRGEYFVQHSDFANVPGFLLVKASWCGHCKTFAPIFQEAAEQVNSPEGFAMTAIEYSELTETDMEELGVAGFPTVLRFEAGGRIVPSPFNGSRTVAGLLGGVCAMFSPGVRSSKGFCGRN